MTSIAMLFCFPVQNFTEIVQSGAELWQKTIFKMVENFLKLILYGG